MANKNKEKISESKSEDMRLIKQALGGKQNAYERLMKKYAGYTRNLIFRMITNREDVEDLTQEAFIKAFNSLDKFDNQFAFSTWLFKIATNNCIDYIRKKKLNTYSIDKEISTDEDDMKFEIPDSENLPDKEIIDKQRKKILANAIERLPARYKTVILMRHRDDMEYEEIAKKLKLPIGTVKAHIFRGRELLNKYLKDKLSNF
ncbi:MAG TPA: sigma-70 family RNA polymerase sigma factor [Ignavibacteria bacterium]|jgi:RNA polymerase sigma-70 factor (ECF subfamily)